MSEKMSKRKDLVHSFGGPTHIEWPQCFGCWIVVAGVCSGAQLLAYIMRQGAN